MNTATASARAAGTMKDRRHAPPSRIGPEASPLATIATPMPDQTSDPAADTFFRFGCVEDDEKDGEHAEARGEPGDEAACRHRRNVGRQPADEHGAGEDEMAGAAERQRAYFRVERRRRQRAEQVADEVKRSEQPGGGQAELQVAREGREHDPVGDACDADVQADREHRDGQQDE